MSNSSSSKQHSWQ